ncbi:hypothetical protein BJX96DRAFT_183355 [Aspergillus floccosus]
MSEVSNQRFRRACVSCRQRKRRCDGEYPCTYCSRNAHHCEYGDALRRSKHRHSRRRQSSTEDVGECANDGFQLRLLEANSGAVFVRQLGLKINPAQAPRLNYYAWNLGLNREIATSSQPLNITEILTPVQMRELAGEYFTHVAPAYSFLEYDDLVEMINKRWASEWIGDSSDALLCGVAALGCLFGGQSPSLEIQLAHSAHNELERSTLLPSPEVDHAVGWLLRVIYLRATGSAHATWMASCTLMHMVETTKLHLEPSNDFILAQSGKSYPPELRRRVFWVARLFNTWISSDCGKSQVELRGASSELPRQSWTEDQKNLCFLSCSFLGPGINLEPAAMEEELSNLGALGPVHPMLQLLQCNLALCFYRRSRSLGQPLTDSSLKLIMDLAKSSLRAIGGLMKTSSPWWHIINVPFQVVCALLAIDNDQALRLLPEALHVLRNLVSQYNTPTCREAYEIACSLLDRLTSALDEHKLAPPLTTLGRNIDVSDSGYRQRFSFLSPRNSGIGGDTTSSLVDYFLLDNLCYITGT